RRSLWPRITQVAPASAAWAAETSPVHAPEASQWQSWAQVAIDEPSRRLATALSAVNTGATPTATPLTAPSWFLSSVTRVSDSAIVLWSFQLPTTKGVRMAKVVPGRRARPLPLCPRDAVFAAPRASEGARGVHHADRAGAGQLDDALELGGDQRADIGRARVAVHHDVGAARH